MGTTLVIARATCLRGYRALVDELGGDGSELLHRFGIDPDTTDSGDTMISADVIGWALEVAAAALNCPDFGLRLAARQDLTIIGPLAVAVVNAATVGQALTCLSRYLFTHHNGISIAVVPDPERQNGTVALHFRDPAEHNGFRQGIDIAAGVIHKCLLQRILGPHYTLCTLHLPHEPLAPQATYTDYFGTEVRFAMPTTLFRFPAELLARPVPGSDPMINTMAIEYLARHFGELDNSVAAQVRIAIEHTAATAHPDIELVARTLSIHERSLQRALAAEGTTFTEILDDARRATVHRLLCETDLPISRIATLVWMREQSALTRAVRRWFGATPQAIRNGARSQRRHHTPVDIQLTPHR